MPQKLKFKKTHKKSFIKNKNYIVILLGIFISIMLGILAGNCLAKYEENKKVNILTKIAKPIFEIEGGEVLKIQNNDKIATYKFEIKNYDQENINQVDMEYDIEILTNEYNSIKYNLLKNGEKIELKDYKTPKIFLKKEEKDIQKYELQIEYNDLECYEDIHEKIYIKINSIQNV